MNSNEQKPSNQSPFSPKGKGPKKFILNINLLYTLIAVIFGVILFSNSFQNSKELSWSDFETLVSHNHVEKLVIVGNKNMMEVYIRPDSAVAALGEGAAQYGANPMVTIQIGSSTQPQEFLKEQRDLLNKQSNQALLRGDTLQSKLAESQVDTYKLPTSYREDRDIMGNLLWSVGPIILMIVFWVFIMRRMSGGGGGPGGNVFNVGKSKAQLFDKETQTKTTFKQVAGLAEAKQEVEEIVEFLKNPSKFTELGGKIPKGALLVGPPGTGKTLLAKAVAGEAEVPFFSLSGSDFVEMFVGVGASRVRDLFRQAKEKSPCIIFIDEIDAIGRARGKNASMGGNDERENTLNQLLTEMDGFGTNSGIIILAATNRADILDKALLRAGRFDRQIYVELPDLKERKEIFNVHLAPLKIDQSVDVDQLARQTPGFSGADIANVCNEAALIAARKTKTAVEKQDFLDAVDRIIGGLEKKNKVLTVEEKRAIAIHEAGHATLSWMLEHAHPLVKVTIVPRGRALGAAWYMPEERQITTKEQMLDEMCSTLGGRAAEELFLGRISSGALNDLQRVTRQSISMVAYLGMSETMPNLCYYDPESEYSFQKPYSDKTAELIDNEVKAQIAREYERAKFMLEENREGHQKLAQLLIEKEVIFAEDLELIFGKRKWSSRSDELFSEAPEVEKPDVTTTPTDTID